MPIATLILILPPPAAVLTLRNSTYRIRKSHALFTMGKAVSKRTLQRSPKDENLSTSCKAPFPPIPS
jgi:hypothetical protein